MPTVSIVSQFPRHVSRKQNSALGKFYICTYNMTYIWGIGLSSPFSYDGAPKCVCVWNACPLVIQYCFALLSVRLDFGFRLREFKRHVRCYVRTAVGVEHLVDTHQVGGHLGTDCTAVHALVSSLVSKPLCVLSTNNLCRAFAGRPELATTSSTADDLTHPPISICVVESVDQLSASLPFRLQLVYCCVPSQLPQ